MLMILLAACAPGEEKPSIYAGCTATADDTALYEGESLPVRRQTTTWDELGREVYHDEAELYPEYELRLVVETTWLDEERVDYLLWSNPRDVEASYRHVYVYGASGLLDELQTWSYDGTNHRFSVYYTYDEQGRLVREDMGGPGHQAWTYDDEGRVSTSYLQGTEGITRAWSWEYDAQGREIAAYEGPDLDQWTWRLTSEWELEFLSRQEEWDGPALEDKWRFLKEYAYTWDEEGRLATEQEVSQDGQGHVYLYSYDGVGLPDPVFEPVQALA